LCLHLEQGRLPKPGAAGLCSPGQVLNSDLRYLDGRIRTGGTDVAMGTVKWFKPDKGYDSSGRRTATRTCSFIFRLFRRPATPASLKAPGSVTNWLLAAPASCPPRICASGDARASRWHSVCSRRTNLGGRRYLPMGLFVFEPIHVNANAPGGACVLRTFADVGAFVLISVDLPRRLSPHWSAVRGDLVQARFGARRAEAHQALRDALAAEGWLAG